MRYSEPLMLRGPVEAEAACRRRLRRCGLRLVALRARHREPDPLADYYVILDEANKSAAAVLHCSELIRWVESLDQKRNQSRH